MYSATRYVSFILVLSNHLLVFEGAPASLGHPLYTPSPKYLTLPLKILHLQSSQSRILPQLGTGCTKMPCPSHALLSMLSTRNLTNLWCWLVLQNQVCSIFKISIPNFRFTTLIPKFANPNYDFPHWS